MQSEDPRYLKRKIRSGSIDVHPTEKALVVNYELEALILGEMGDPMLGDKKEYQKIIRLNCLNSKTDCAALAREVVDKCSLIHHSKLNEVEHLIHYLKNRKDHTLERDSPQSHNITNAEINDKPSINNMEKYVDYLYEDTCEKIIGSAMVLKLAKNSNNLEELVANESALSALARVLREDWKKNVDLATNIVCIFYCFSSYTQFHNIVIQYKIGSLCMELVDWELRRYDTWKGINNDERIPSPVQRSNSPSCKKRQSLIPVGKRRSESANRLSASSDELRSSLPATPVNPNKKMIDIIGTDGFDGTDGIGKKDDEQLQAHIKKQEQLLCVAVRLLLNIAENCRVEDKMRKRNISFMLIKMLERKNVDLLITCVKFLKKLSIYQENKDDMADLNIIEKLCRIISTNNSELLSVTLRLLYNLSFDTALRNKMVRQGYLQRLVTLMEKDQDRVAVLGILYHLSMDDKVKSTFSYTDCIPILMNFLLENKSHKLTTSLCINLALNKQNAEIMVKENRLQMLLTKAFKTQDSLVMKMIHNISLHEGIKQYIVEFVGDISKAVTECESEEFVLECVGILANLTLPELDYNQVFQQFNLIDWITNVLVNGKSEDDLILEVVMLLGTAACDEDCAMLMCKSNLLNSLIELLKAKQEDDEIVLQIVYMFYQVIRHDETRDYLIKETDAPAYLIDLMQDKNKEIAALCDACLDIISEYHNDWKRRIMVDKFRFHNSHWLEMVESQAFDDSSYGLTNDELSPYLTSELMNNAMLYPTESRDDYEHRPPSRYSRNIDLELMDEDFDTNQILTVN